MIGTSWQLRKYGMSFLFLISVIMFVVLIPSSLVNAQEEEFTWEGDWNLYQDSWDGTVPIRILQSADGTYTMGC